MKYKLLITDDEYLVRMGIRETIDWESLNVEVCGEAANGKQGLAMARSLRPDLIISDVRMPVMDGLEMAQILLEEEADLAVIIYSGYQDFEYARRALNSEVAAYLLKPIVNEQMVEKVKETLGKLEQKRKRHKILDLMEEGTPLIRRRLFSEWLSYGEMDEERKNRMRLVGIEPLTNGRVVFATASEGTEPLSLLGTQLTQLLCNYSPQSEIVEDALCIVSTLDNDENFMGEVSRLFAQNIKVNDVKFKICVGRYFGKGRTLCETYSEVRTFCLGLPYAVLSSVHAVEGETPTMYKKLVRDALNYIEINYAKKLSIRIVAEELYVSESHLMHEFKDGVGKTFNECLTEYRIEKAKALLLKGKHRVNEIAGAVGYADVKYFGQVFKEMTGCTPGEYASVNAI